jgi:hypothetical protein
MCDFISIAVPKRGDGSAPLSRRGFALSPHNSPVLTQWLPPGFAAWILTTRGCSCALSCGGKHQPADDGSLVFRDDATEILQQIGTRYGRMFVYVHQYGGDISTERLPLLRKEQRKLETLTRGQTFHRDTLIEFVK